MSDRSRYAALARHRPGERSMGPYVVEKLLGHGRETLVYRARHRAQRGAFALKTNAVVGHPTASKRLQREALAAMRVRSPHVVRAVDAFAIEEGRVGVVFEYLPGRTLRNLMRSERFTTQDAIQLCAQIAKGLACLHAAQVVHRDVKPSNIVVCGDLPNATATLIDLGAATLEGAPSTTVPVGSPPYMAPEQALGEAVDERADVFGLGATVYRLLTGRPPHIGCSPREVLTAAARGEVLPARMVNPSVPAAVGAVTDRALARLPQDRFQTVRELGLALARAATRRRDSRRLIAVGDRPRGLPRTRKPRTAKAS